MAVLAPTLFTARNNQLPIETARAIAILLLVAYHVIGAGPDAGLRIGYPAPLRLFADFFVDLRMPLFALIAGMVFAMKPPEPSGLGSFFRGKLRRLVLPGLVAMAAFELSSKLGHTSLEVSNHYLRPLITGYAHFWFLQSILLIFVVYAPLDSLTRGKIAPFALVGAVLLSLSGIGVPDDLFSADGAMMLMPYFIIGVLIWRHRSRILAHRWPLALAALILLIVGSLWNLRVLQETGMFSSDRRDLQSLISATGGCVLAMLALPRIRWLDGIGAMSFTIYLYHVFGTSLMRRLLEGIGMDILWLQMIAGIAAGLALPILIHKLAERNNFTRLVLLGLKPLQPQQEKSARTQSRTT
ncbi:acyltransferase [Paracoccus sp. M683]|uniref:acyltransferase family protein n=1 Tax=Paracoccus sp. M683 TaxID=2594268 RepID=UPI00117F3F30|nr:acyltransferase [Paracoccus sp. M683]TRW97558.1 acyltransferase [Paracoccus sp. M683]